MKYAIVTFGCRVNQADSLAFEEALVARGGEATAPDQADLVVINTCSVTASADQGARQTARRIARTNPGVRLVFTGCYASRREDEVAALPNVVRVLRNVDKDRLGPVLDETLGALGLTTAERFGDGDGSCGARLEPGAAGRTAFTLRVQTGCAQPCSYCIIPVTRGTPRSVPIADLLRQIERAADAGYREIALTGVHLGSYGRDLPKPATLYQLLDAIAGARVPGVRFRVSSLEPMDCHPEIVDLIADGGCFAAHLHLPLQHASDRVLAAMRRPYSRRQYEGLVARVRERLPHASIGSDVIAGFPGETEDDFGELVDYLERSPLSHVHVFPYSDRPGTPAAALDGKVPGLAVRARAHRLRDISAALTRRFRDQQRGTTHRALAIEDGTVVVTGNYLKVRIAPGRRRNDWVDVTVTGVSADGIVGEVIADETGAERGAERVRAR